MSIRDWKPEDWLAVVALATVSFVVILAVLVSLFIQTTDKQSENIGEAIFGLLSLASTYLGFKLGRMYERRNGENQE